MANLLGDVWAAGTPDWQAALADPAVKLHLYGKEEARAGRKMGHLTALAATTAEAVAKVRAARVLLSSRDLP
jgi:5-(carboxyamino)imidazole ribonucleotide synthase